MNKRLFGTDGIRGEANVYPMLPEIALKLGRAIGYLFKDRASQKVIIGKDTRLSGYIFESALVAGLCSMGVSVGLLGPLPTPAIAFLTKDMRAEAGIVISASHNPYYDNGIKIFNSQGFKLSDEKELEIERLVFDPEFEKERKLKAELGRAFRIADATGRYAVYLKSVVPTHINFEGIKVVIDCANGAAYHVGPLVLSELGAEVICIGCSPNGLNINKDCGALYPEALRKKVVESKAHIGIALDGDADRIVVANEKGELLDGDDLLAIFALDLKNKGLLKANTVVGTIMTNLGLEEFLNSHSIEFRRTPVGDRYVTLELLKIRGVLGGETSGHIIFLDKATTGDGLLTALRLLSIMKEKEKPLSEIIPKFTKYPQITKNIKVSKKLPVEEIPGLPELIKKAQNSLKRGRIIVRPSGTEPKYRITIETPEKELGETLVEEIASFIKRQLG
jgi:phosphoglucosamine mutase